MKIHAYFISYNEEKIMPHLLKYYGSFCEKITIIDNESTDATQAIVKSFPNVNLMTYNSNNEMRDDYCLKIKNNCWKISRGVADYVIVGDCDEFIYHERLNDLLEISKQQNVAIFKPKGYHMVADKGFDIVNGNLLEDVKLGVREVLLDKCLIFDPNVVNEINYGLGCHMCNPIGSILKIATNKDLYLKHFKFVGIQNYIDKSIMYKQRLSLYNKERQLSMHYNRSEDEVIKDYEYHLNMRVELC